MDTIAWKTAQHTFSSTLLSSDHCLLSDRLCRTYRRFRPLCRQQNTTCLLVVQTNTQTVSTIMPRGSRKRPASRSPSRDRSSSPARATPTSSSQTQPKRATKELTKRQCKLKEWEGKTPEEVLGNYVPSISQLKLIATSHTASSMDIKSL